MEMTLKTPEDLLAGIGRSIMAKAIVLSILAHIVLMGATSVSLFRDWAKYGVKSPSAINVIRTQENRAAEEARKKAEAEAKAAAEAKAEAEAKARIAEEQKKGGAKPAEKTAPRDEGVASEGAARTAEAGEKKPPEIEPLPPKKEFQYGEDLSLD